MPLTPGTKLGNYEILSELGAGGMGEVYRARDPKLGRDVAVKVLPELFAQDENLLARFEREARAVAALSHPNILAIYDFGSEAGHAYAVTELLEGETLRERLGGDALSTRKAIEYGAQVARGLAAAHEKGITHRDLKPENLFVTHDGRVKILDFGLAKTQGLETATKDSDSSAPTRAAVTDPGVVLGTVGYMSPEQVRGERVGHRSDIFSFGSILYEMLAGRRAFQRDTSAETMTAILKEEPPELSGLDGVPPPALERIVHRCLEKKPGERFQSAYDLAFAIESVSRESETAPVERAIRKPQGRTIVAAALGLLLMVAAYWLVRGSGAPGGAPLLSYERLTFRRGTVYAAQFDPGGRDVIYTASWDGQVPEIYATLPGTRASRALGFSGADVLSVSPNGEMALLRKAAVLAWEDAGRGTLALSTASGSAAREISEDVVLADWTADGERLAVVRLINGQHQVELPIGTVLYETTNAVDSLRVSPQGNVLAFGEKARGYATNWSVVFLELDGETRRFDTGFRGDFIDLAWSPHGGEVWFDTSLGGEPDLHAMSLTGEVRLLARSAIPLRILDVARDGRALVARTNVRFGVMGVAPGETVEREFSWLDSTEVDGISGDGRTLLLTEFGEGGGEGWSVYLRNVDGSPAVHLGEGAAFDLSPNGEWALTLRRGEPGSLVLLPTGPGTPIVVENTTIVEFFTASFVSDENEVVFAGSEEGAPLRWFRQAVPSGEPQPITGEVQTGQASVSLGTSPVSPDGSMLAAAKDGVIALYPLDGGEPRALDDVPASMRVIRFTPDGRFLYVREPVGRSQKVHRIEIETGRRELWKTIAPSDPTGLEEIYAVQISDDGECYYYTFIRTYSDLYLVEGLR